MNTTPSSGALSSGAPLVATVRPYLAPPPWDTGSHALGTLLTRTYMPRGAVLHLFCGDAGIQRHVLLGLGHTAVGRGERSAFLDLDNALAARDVEGAGLGGVWNPHNPGDLDAGFRTLVPAVFKDVRFALGKVAAQVSSAQVLSAQVFSAQRPLTSVVVVEGLQVALFREFAVPHSERDLQRAAAWLMGELLGYSVAVSKGNFALWISHSPKVTRSRLAVPTGYRGAFPTATRNTLKKECRGGLQLGEARAEEGGDSVRVPVTARDYRGRVVGESSFALWRGGGFKN